MAFEINQQLKNDTHYLFKHGIFHVLLHKNASIPWIILVPTTDVTEVFDLSPSQQLTLSLLTKNIAKYFKQNLAVEKMNTAAIGNIVSQLHIHVIGRKPNDASWPDVVWGNKYKFRPYEESQIEILKTSLSHLN